MTSFPRSDVLEACEKYGPQLNVDPALEGAAVMKAIASNESSVGANCGPRHEPAYDQGGAIFRSSSQQQQLVQDYGAAAASSFGPWQMMFINFSAGVQAAIANGTVTIDDYAQELVRFFNNYVIGGRHAVTLSDVGQVWNAGHVSATPAPGVMVYVDHLLEAYALFSTSGEQAA